MAVLRAWHGGLRDLATRSSGRSWGPPPRPGDCPGSRYGGNLPGVGRSRKDFLPDSEGGAGLHEGDFVSVRVTRASQGGKGPRLTAHLALDEILPARGPGALLELARVHPDARVLIDDGALAARLKPSLGDRVVVVTRAFDADIEEQVEALAQPDIELAGGVRLEHPAPTPAPTPQSTSTAAARWQGGEARPRPIEQRIRPLCRSWRGRFGLRNLSGAILVDFAGLKARGRASLAPALHAALAQDPLRPRLLGFTASGLAEIVRRRVHPPLHELLDGRTCRGVGGVASDCDRDRRRHRTGCRCCARRRRSCGRSRTTRGPAGPCAPGGARLDASAGSPPARDSVEHRGERWLKPCARGRPALSAADKRWRAASVLQPAVCGGGPGPVAHRALSDPGDARRDRRQVGGGANLIGAVACVMGSGPAPR